MDNQFKIQSISQQSWYVVLCGSSNSYKWVVWWNRGEGS